MPRENIKEQAKRVLGDDFFNSDDVSFFGRIEIAEQHRRILDPALKCEKHQWTGDPIYGPCPTCRKELQEEAHAKKLQTWERYRDLVSLTERLLPEFVRGCHTEEELSIGTMQAVTVARNALALLESDRPKEPA